MADVALPRLQATALTVLAARGWDVPAYARSGEPGVVHLGLGGFHRAHQALVFDAMMRRADARWGVLGVGMNHAVLADALAAQDGLYAVRVADHQGLRWQLAGAIWRTAVAAREPQRVMAAIAAPGTRWVTLTVTEKGHGPQLANLLVGALQERHAKALGGLTIASCDNQRGNGNAVRDLCLNEARTRDPALAHWITEACAFPNSMVDRIVPTATADMQAQAAQTLELQDAGAIGTEAFWEWVIEDRFVDAGDADALRRVGVRVVADVLPYEDAKLRMLNGSHTALACIGAVLGLEHVHDCVVDARVGQFVRAFMSEDVGPQLARADWPTYRDALLQRFANPSLCHRVHQICLDTSQKIPQRWVATALAAVAAGQLPQHLAFAAAAWIRYLRGVDEQGRAYALDDPMATTLQALARQHAGQPQQAVMALGTLPAIWGAELAACTPWLASVSHWLGRIEQVGLHSALDELANSGRPALT